MVLSLENINEDNSHEGALLQFIYTLDCFCHGVVSTSDIFRIHIGESS